MTLYGAVGRPLGGEGRERPGPWRERTPLPRRPPTWAAAPAPWGPDLPAPRPCGPAQEASVCFSRWFSLPRGPCLLPAHCTPTVCISGHSLLPGDARNSMGRVGALPSSFLPPGPRACLVQRTGWGVLPSFLLGPEPAWSREQTPPSSPQPLPPALSPTSPPSPHSPR